MDSRYDALAGRVEPTNLVTKSQPQSFGSIRPPAKVYGPGMAEASTAPASAHAHASHHGGGGGFLSALVNRPNNVPQNQAFFQKNAGAVYVHRLGPHDAAVNRLIFGFTLLGLGSVLFTLGSMSLGVNKKKKA